MRRGRALGEREQAVAAFVARELGCEATRVVRVDAFATNAVHQPRYNFMESTARTNPLESPIRLTAGDWQQGC